MAREYFVYILANTRGTLYVGVSNDLRRRLYQHESRHFESFTARYDVTRLVYFEIFTDIRAAIKREKELKGWRRVRKNRLVGASNPKWHDLAADWFERS